MDTSLLLIGIQNSKDTSIFSNETINSMKSHIKLLQKSGNVKELADSSHETITEVLNNLRNKNNKPYSKSYLVQIANTLNSINKNLNYKYEGKGSSNNADGKNKTIVKDNRWYNVDFTKIIGSILRNGYIFLKKITEHKRIATSFEMNDYMLHLTINLCCATGLRISEILQLTYKHLDRIQNGESILIRTKKRNMKTDRHIEMTTLLGNLIYMANFNRDKVAKYLVFQNKNKVKNLDKYIAQSQKFNNNFVILLSMSYLQKLLRQYIMKNNTVAVNKGLVFGFNIFRKYITTTLTDNGHPYVAQQYNNHKSINTTMNDYNLISLQAVNDAMQPFTSGATKQQKTYLYGNSSPPTAAASTTGSLPDENQEIKSGNVTDTEEFPMDITLNLKRRRNKDVFEEQPSTSTPIITSKKKKHVPKIEGTFNIKQEPDY